MRRFSLAVMLVLAAVVAGALVGAMPQPLQDPWYRPLNPQGSSAGVTYGQTAPSLASIGANPGQGELWVDTNGATDGGPILNVFDHVTGVWDGVLNSGALTNNVIPKFNGTELIDSTVSDDAVDVVATGGLLTVGTAVDAADSILLDGNNDTLQFEGGTDDAAEITFVAVDPDTDLVITLDNPGASTDGDWMLMAAALAQQDAGNTVDMVEISLDNPVAHLGAAVISGLRLTVDGNTIANERAITISDNWDYEIYFAGTSAGIVRANDATQVMMDVGGANQFWLRDVPAAGASADLTEITVTPSIMDAVGGDVQSAMVIDVTNVVHTGGNLYGLEIEGIVQAAGAEEAAIFVGATWDIDIHFGSATALVNWFETGSLELSDYGGQNEIIFSDIAVDNGDPAVVMELDPTLSIMDGAGDIQRVVHLDIDNVDHTNGSVYGVHFDNDTNDAQSAEIAAVITDTWDIDVAWPDAGDLILGDLGGDMTFTLEDVPDLTGADAAVALVEIDFTPGIIDAGDTLTALLVDVGTAVHTGGDVIGINVDDAAATAAAEYAQRFGTGWDREIDFADTTAVVRHAGEIRFMDTVARSNIYFRDVPAAGTADDIVDLDLTLTAMDGAGDTFRAILVDIANADHTNGVLYGLDLDLSAQDPQAAEIGIRYTGGWDWDWQSVGVAFAALGAPANGTFVYCTDCTEADPCAAAGAGAFAMRLNARWDCN